MIKFKAPKFVVQNRTANNKVHHTHSLHQVAVGIISLLEDITEEEFPAWKLSCQ